MEARQRELDAQYADLEARRSEAGQCREETEQRSSELEALRRELTETQSRLRTQESENEAKRAELETLASEMEARQRELDAQYADLEARRSDAGQCREEAEQRSSELEALRRELTETQSRLEAQESENEAKRAELERLASEIGIRQRELDGSLAESRVREADAQRREELAELRARELDSRSSELDVAVRQLESDRRAFQAEVERWERERTTACPVPPEPDFPEGPKSQEPSPSSPIQSVEILRRLGFSVPGDDDSPEGLPEVRRSPAPDESGHGSLWRETNACGEGDAGSTGPDAGEALVGTATETPSENAHHEEESIDQYMARLLERMRNPNAPTQGPPRPVQVEEPKRVEASDHEAPDAEAPPPAEEPLRELTPRAVAPERTFNLSAMRELANFSATAAIKTHARGRLVRASGSKLLVAVVGAVCGGLLLWHSVALNGSTLTLFSAATSFVIALFWSLQYLIFTGKVIATRPTEDLPGVAPSEQGPSLAIDPPPARGPKARPITPGSESAETEPAER